MAWLFSLAMVPPLSLACQVLGTPTKEQLYSMNKNYTEFKFPQVKQYPWSKVRSHVHVRVCVCACARVCASVRARVCVCVFWGGGTQPGMRAGYAYTAMASTLTACCARACFS